jgi:hypothetical protein
VISRRGTLVGLVVVALCVPAQALAQEPPAAGAAQAAGAAPQGAEDAAPAKSDEGRGQAKRRQARQPAPAKLTLAPQNARGGKIQVGKRVRVKGKLRPFVEGQRVRVWLQKARKTVSARWVAVRRVPGRNVGVFSFSTPKLIKQGHYRIYARKPPTRDQGKASARTREFNVSYPDLDPGDRSNLVKLLNKLLAKQAYYTSQGRKYGGATQRAIMAFRKVNNMKRTTNATPRIFAMLANGKGGFKLKWPQGGKHIEADLSRQVMVLANKGKPQHIFHISSGKPSTPTVTGKFRTYRKTPGVNSLGMIDSVYFHRGYATHGYKSVPPYPASHGCLRTPPQNARFIYNWIDYGGVFYIYP